MSLHSLYYIEPVDEDHLRVWLVDLDHLRDELWAGRGDLFRVLNPLSRWGGCDDQEVRFPELQGIVWDSWEFPRTNHHAILEVMKQANMSPYISFSLGEDAPHVSD